jgi:hypothetical protein
MKKATVLLLVTLSTLFSFAQTVDPTDDGFPLQLGNVLSTNQNLRNINFLVNNDAPSGQRILANYYMDNNGANRNTYFATNLTSSFYLSDENGNEFFKIDEGHLANDKVFLQLLKPDSRIIIGSHAYYEPNYKLAIRQGSAIVDGNIISNQNIGIGTELFEDNTGSYRLSVDGKIRATGIRVYTDWADYVFEDNYYLKPLNEVEHFIEENGHLPNIPSEKNVLENGIELGEMNKLLLEKIEELTLYLIKQNKEIKDLKSQINSLQN